MKKITKDSVERDRKLNFLKFRKESREKNASRHARRVARWRFLGRHRQIVKFVAPKFFDLIVVQDRHDVVRFLRGLGRSVREGHEQIHISFCQTRRMYTCGTLLFLAELDRLQYQSRGRLRLTCSYPSDLIVEQVLQKVGFFKLIGKRERIKEDLYDETVRHWHAAVGTQAIGADVDPVLSAFEGKITPALNRSLYKAVTEAMTNCTQHAYTDARGDGVPMQCDPKKWWMFSQEKDGRLHVAICDLGIGIPRSIRDKPIPGWHEALLKYLGPRAQSWVTRESDAPLIRAALELGKTRTGLPYRGKGLSQIIDVISQDQEGEITIHSNSGCYIRNLTQHAPEKAVGYRESILGTLILWSIPLAAQEET